MTVKWQVWAAPLAIALLSAADPSWSDKPISAWTAADAQQALTDSPWVKSVTSKFASQRVRAVLIQPVTPMGRPYGMPRAVTVKSPRPAGDPPALTLRWESALPMRVVQIKSHNLNSPAIDDDHYGVAVYGIPERVLGIDPDTFTVRLKPEGSLKREGKKTIHASSILLLPRDNGSIVVFYFPKTEEISVKDKSIEFSGRIGPIEFEQSFPLADMIFDRKLEL